MPLSPLRVSRQLLHCDRAQRICRLLSEFNKLLCVFKEAPAPTFSGVERPHQVIRARVGEYPKVSKAPTSTESCLRCFVVVVDLMMRMLLLLYRGSNKGARQRACFSNERNDASVVFTALDKNDIFVCPNGQLG